MLIKTKRACVRLVSYVCAVIISLSVFGALEKKKADKYESQVNLSYQQAISGLSSYLDTIKTDLYKGMYASTPAMTGKLSASLLSSSSGALECISRLPSAQGKLYNAYKFLTQVGAFTDSLNEKTANGENISDEEYETMEKLYKYASTLSGQISYAQEMTLGTGLNFEQSVSSLSLPSADKAGIVNFSDTVDETEESFSDFPTLIYDGPFSDNITNKASSFLEGKTEISQSAAAEIASKITGSDKKNVKFAYDDASNVSSYVFTVGSKTVSITKKGGYPSYMISDVYAHEEVMNKDDAVKIGYEFLNNCGYTGMTDTYYADSDGICTINYAYKFGDVTCYTDLIKVSVSLTDGSVTGFDARGYLMNHTDRSFPENEKGFSAAAECISSRLTPQSVKKTVIPTDSASENFAYEFKCTAPDGTDVLVYIDALTLQEDQILILLYSDGGIFTK